MVTIRVDFNKQIGKIKPLHGVGQPPFTADVYECPNKSGQLSANILYGIIQRDGQMDFNMI